MARFSPRFLIVEDDPGTRLLLQAVLHRLGVPTDSAGDGASALVKLRHQRYDGILLDLMLPIVNGFELLREMRAIDPELLSRTIIITAASDLTLRDFDRTQVLSVMRKPFELDELRAVVRCCLPELAATG